MLEVEGGSRAAAPKGLGLGLRGWDLGLKAGIWASRLEFGPQDWDLRGVDGGEGGEGKISPMCESIGHRPLRGRCPAPSLNFKHNQLRQGTDTADHLTLLRLLFLFFL